MTDIALPAAQIPEAAPSEPIPHPRRWLILAILLTAELMDILDGTIVNVAAPSIRSDLSASASALQWIVGGYALTYALGLVPAARLGDIVGRRLMFVIGTAGFTLTSAICAAAPTSGVLIATRLLQGGFAAIMIPQALSIIRGIFPKEDLPKVFGLWGPVIGIGAVLGPVLGGLLISADLFDSGWRLVFLINVPLGLAGTYGALRLMPESRLPTVPTLDVTGGLIIAAASALVIYPLIQGHDAGWPGWMFVMLAVGIALFVVFGVFERSRVRRGRSPLVELSIFAKRAYSSGIGIVWLFFGGMMGVLLCMTLFLQIGSHFSAIHAGLTIAPWSFGTAIGAALGAGVLVPRIGRAGLHVGYVVMLVATVLTIVVVHHDGAHITTWQLFGPSLLLGIGLGMCIAPLFSFILAAVDEQETGSASGVLNALQQFGGAAGIAVLGTVFFSAIEHRSFASALITVLWIECGVLVVCALLTFLLPQEARPEEF